jgi:hypothetical protein
MPLTDALLLDPYPVPAYVARRTDGVAGSGTLADPWNGNTPERFDSLMNNVPPQTRIHLGPGVFETKGYSDQADAGYGWQPKPGQKIVGSGIGVTTLKLVGASVADAHYFAIGHALWDPTAQLPNLLDFFEVSDLTIDCNLDGQTGGADMACGAIRVMGNYALIKRVKVIAWGTKTASKTCFVLSVITADPPSKVYEVMDPGIEDCIAVEPSTAGSEPGRKITVLHAGPKDDTAALEEAYGRGPFIRNCYVDCGTLTLPADREYRALSMGWCRGGLVEANQVHNTTYGGPYLESNARDIIVRGNAFLNVLKWPYGSIGLLPLLGDEALHLDSLVRDPTDHGLALATTQLSPHPLAAGERVKIDASAGSPAEFKGVFVIDSVEPPNQFRYRMTSEPTGDASDATMRKVFAVQRLVIENNVIELPADTSGGVGIHMEDNGLADQTPDHACGDVIIRGNVIRYQDGQTSPDATGTAIEVNGAKNLLVRENIVEVTPPDPIAFQRCGSVKYFNNRTADGELLARYDSATGRPVEEYDAEAEVGLVLCLFKR